MNKKSGYLIMAGLILMSPPLLALTDAEIEARLNEYAAKIRALETELANAKKAPVYEQDLGKSSGKLERQIQQVRDKMSSEEQRFRMNGFMTAAVSMADDSLDGTAGGAYEIDDSPSFTGDSKIGMQFNYRLSERADATIQLLARGRGKSFGNSSESWGVAAEWAYLGYQLTDSVKVRMGRLRIPFYMYSETLDVGYTYPWVRPPLEMYTTAVTSYNGADVLYRFSTGKVNHALQFFTGANSDTNNIIGDSDSEIASDLQDMYGINLTSTFGPWTLRAMASTMKIDGDAAVRADTVVPAAMLASMDSATLLATLALGGVNFDSCDEFDLSGVGVGPFHCLAGGYFHSTVDEKFNYYALGTQYDDGSLFVIGEIAKLTTDRARLFSDAVQQYVTVGYRVNLWTPYATYAHTYDTESAAYLAANNLDPTVAPMNQKSRSIGVRYELTPSTSAKLEWNHQYDLENIGSSFGDDINIYTFALDAVF